MKKLATSLMTATLLASVLIGCSTKSENRNDPDVPIFKSEKVLAATDVSSDKDLQKKYSEFVIGLAQKCAQNSDENILVSPDSILFALDMTAAGAAGTTRDQMTGTLVPGADPVDALAFGVSHYNELQNDSICIADSVWLNEEYANTVKSDFTDFAQNDFDARIEAIKFDNDAVDTINAWVSDNTKERIPELLSYDDINDKSFMFIINAIAFDGTWETAFTNTYEDYFNYDPDSDDNESIEYLAGSTSLYIEAADATGFIKPYNDGRFAFMAILPDDESMTGNEYLQNMTADDYWSLWESQSDENVNISLPKFENTYSVELKDILSEMGMSEAFSDNADFSFMTDKTVKIDKVIHKTYIDVNEEGTSAAAATAVAITRTNSVAKDDTLCVRCNRPFVYAIVDLDTGLPVFLGTFDQVG